MKLEPYEFIDNPAFHTRNAIKLLEFEVIEGIHTNNRIPKPKSGEPDILYSYDYPLLTREGEKWLFLQYNCAKHKFNEALKNTRNEPQLVRLQSIADESRRQIACRNIRLVRNVVNGNWHANPQNQDDMRGHSYVTLMRAIECFDVKRGNKFSTYLTWCIRRNSVRDSQLTNPRSGTFTCGPLFSVHDSREIDYDTGEEIARIMKYLGRLHHRERDVIKSLFGIDEPVKTLDEASRIYGVCRERVRQFKERGLQNIKMYILREEIDCSRRSAEIAKAS